MADYQLIVADLLTGKVLGEVPAVSAEWTLVRNGVDTLDVTISLSQPDAVITAIGAVVPGDMGRISFTLTRDGTIVAGGPAIGTYDADFGAGTLQVHAQGWHAYIARRTLRADLAFAAEDQTSNIAATLIGHTQTTGQTPVISTSDIAASGVLRDRTYNAADRNNIGQLVEDLAADENGFSFRYETIRNGDLIQARVLTGPDTGRRTNLVWAQGKNITAMSAHGDATGLVTHVDGIGAGTGSQALRTTVANAPLIGVYPLLDASVSHTDVTVRSTLDSYARRRLARGKAPVVLPEADVNPAADPVLGSYVIGDVARVIGGFGLLSIDGQYMIVQINGQVDKSTEKVNLTFATLDAFVPV